MVWIGETGSGLWSGYNWNKDEGSSVMSGSPDNQEFDPRLGYGRVRVRTQVTLMQSILLADSSGKIRMFPTNGYRYQHMTYREVTVHM
jgi:hypothetical protein